MSPIHVVASTNMDTLQNPHLRIHVSTSLCLRLLCKIQVSGCMSQHPCVSQDPLQDPCCRIQSSAAICISGSSTRSTSSDSCLSIFVSHGFSARSTSPDTCLSIHLYLRILCKIHVSGSMCPIHVLASTKMDPLQDPCLRTQVSASLYLRILYKIHVFGFMSQRPLRWILYKIHVFGFMSQHLCISGSSARSTSPDSCLSILDKIHVFGLMPHHLRISGSSARSMCPIHVLASICISGTSARSMSPDPYISIHMYLRILCKIHVSGFMSQHPRQDPCLRIHASPSSYLRFLCKIHVSDSCLSIHVSASMCISGSSARSMLPDPKLSSHMYLRILYKIHVFGFMSQHLCISRFLCKIHVAGYMSQHPFISQDPLQDPCLQIHVSDSCLSIHQNGSAARSMSPDSSLSIFVSQDSLQDPCLRIYVSASTKMDPLQDPRLRIHVSASLYLRLLCKIHVSGYMSQHLCISGSSARSMSPDSASICISGTSARSMSPDPYISIHMYLRILCKIHVSGFMSQHPRQDPCFRIHASPSSYLRILCKIHVSDSCLSIHVSASMCISGSSARSMLPDP